MRIACPSPIGRRCHEVTDEGIQSLSLEPLSDLRFAPAISPYGREQNAGVGAIEHSEIGQSLPDRVGFVCEKILVTS